MIRTSGRRTSPPRIVDPERVIELDLLEREDALTALSVALEEARQGRGSLVYIEAGVGAGKSSLIEAGAVLAQAAGMLVLRATGRPVERLLPFGVAVQLLDQPWALLLEAAAEHEPRRSLADQILLPGLANGDRPRSDAEFAAIHQLFRAVRDLAESSAADCRNGVALLVDDAHAADASSLSFLAYLTARMAELPVCVVVAALDRGTDARGVALDAIAQTPGCVVLHPAELSLEAVSLVARSYLPAAGPEFVAACFEATSGIPLQLVELISMALALDLAVDSRAARQLAGLVPDSVADRVRAQLASLPSAAAELLHAVARVGDSVTIEGASTAAGLDHESTERAARMLAAAGLLRQGQPLEPATAMIAAIARNLAPAMRRRRDSPAAFGPPAPALRDPSLHPTGTRLPAQRTAVAGLAIHDAVRGGRRDEVRELAMLAWSDGALLELGDPAPAMLLARSLLHVDELDACFQIVGHPGFRALEHDSPQIRAAAGYCRAAALYHRGHVSAARSEASDLVNSLATDRPAFARRAYAVLAACSLQSGRLAHAHAAMAMLTHGDEIEEADLPVMLEVRAQLRLAQGQPLEALRDALEAGRRLRSTSEDSHPGIVPWRSTAALAKVLVRENADARKLAEEELELARSIGVTRVILRALRVQARAARGPQSLGLLTEAVAIGKQYPMRLEYLHALVDLGAATRRARRRAEARSPLRQALDICTRLGVTALATRASEELAASGDRTTRPVVAGIEQLTPSERRVAQLVADGHTTRQIAAELFVTPKTVEFHLRNLYMKLNVPSSRPELVRAIRTAVQLPPAAPGDLSSS